MNRQIPPTTKVVGFVFASVMSDPLALWSGLGTKGAVEYFTTTCEYL
jgi:hypothetical protein